MHGCDSWLWWSVPVAYAACACTPSLCSYLRPDSLAQLLTYANVRAGANMIVVESTGGFVLGAVGEKMGGTRCCFHTNPEPLPSPSLLAHQWLGLSHTVFFPL